MSDLENLHASLRRASELAMPDELIAAQEEISHANNQAANVLDGATHEEALNMQAQLTLAADKLNEAIELLDEARGRIVDMEVRLCVGKAANREVIDIFADDPFTTAVNREGRESLNRPLASNNPLGATFDELHQEAAMLVENDEPHSEDDPELVGEDDISYIFKANDGTIVKFIKPDEWGTPEEKEQSALRTLRGMVASLNVGIGVPGLEQILASDEELKVVVCDALPGVTIHHLLDADLENIPDEHFDQLITTFQEMQALSLDVDYGRQGNAVYDSEKGFTLTDYEHVVVILEDDEFYQRQRIEEKIARFVSANGLLHNHPSYEPVPPAAIRFRDLCARRLGAYVGGAINKQWAKDNLQF